MPDSPSIPWNGFRKPKPTQPHAPQSRQRSHFQKILAYLRPHWRATVFGVLTLLIVNSLGVYIPLLIRRSIDKFQGTFSMTQVAQDAALLLVLASIMWVIRVQSRTLMFGVGRQVEFDLKQKLFAHLLQLEPAYFETHTIGDLINRATSDVENVRRLLGFAILSGVNTLFAYALTVPLMLSINVPLTLAALCVFPLMLILVHLFSDRLRTQQMDVQQELSNLSELIQEDMSGIALIKIYAQEDNERQAFRQRNQRLLAANLLLARSRSLLFPMVGSVAYVSILIMIWLGAGAIAAKQLSIGDFIALVLYVERLVFPTALLGFTITTYQRGEVSVDRVEAILTVQPTIQDAPAAIALPSDQVRGELTAKHLTYRFAGADTAALQDVNFTIAPGETVAIVGPIGSGKSTLANALPRLLDIAPGQLFLDGYDVTQLRLHDLRAAIAYVPQESFLFSTLIKNNIRYGVPLAGQTAVEAAAEDAQIHSEIQNFPQHYDTLVGERGITLSGGQRQRTALARALIIDAPVLILDDALSSVDNQTATQILQNLMTGTRHRTVVFISHQLAAAATADRILVMDQGRIVQLGTHAELASQSGLYQVLWNQYKLEESLQT
jgi:ATP-binding cassette, subfamily B, multidrug efflux pump